MRDLAETLQRKSVTGELSDQELAFIQLKSSPKGGGATLSRRAQRRKAGVSIKKAYGYE